MKSRTINIKKSSVVSGIAYTGGNRVLTVRLVSGQIYRYANVPRDVAVRFAKARSKGAFFARNIVGNYQVDQVVA